MLIYAFRLAVSVVAAAALLAIATDISALTSTNQLQITIASTQNEICVLEGVPVTVTLKNMGTADLRVHLGFLDKRQVSSLEADKIGSIVIRTPGDDIVKLLRPVHTGGSSSGGRPTTLAPNAEFNISFLLSCDFSTDTGSVFKEAGTYGISVQYDDGVVANKSTEITVKVSDAPAAEVEALELVERLKKPVVLYEPDLIGFDKEENLAALQQLTQVKDSRIFAGYARVALAWRYIRTAEMAWSMPEFANFEESLKSAEAMLDGIHMEGFTLAGKAKDLRRQLDQLKALPPAKKSDS